VDFSGDICSRLLCCVCAWTVLGLARSLTKSGVLTIVRGLFAQTALRLLVDHQVRPGRVRVHDPGASLLRLGTETRGLGIERPHDHPMRWLFDGVARSRIRIAGAPVRGARQHVDDARLGISRLRLERKKVALPAQRRGVHALRIIADGARMPRKTGEAVAAFTQHGLGAVLVLIDDARILRDLGRPGGHRARNLGFLGFVL